MGVFLKSGDILVTHATSPGPKAIKTRNIFRKDFSYTTQVFNVLSLKYSVDYLGEWHKHPNDYISYSPKDQNSIHEITQVNLRPCFFVIVGDSFSLETYQKTLKVFTFHLPKQQVVECHWESVTDPEQIAMAKGISI